MTAEGWEITAAVGIEGGAELGRMKEDRRLWRARRETAGSGCWKSSRELCLNKNCETSKLKDLLPKPDPEL